MKALESRINAPDTGCDSIIQDVRVSVKRSARNGLSKITSDAGTENYSGN
ncbi:MAG: hypothetical protein P1R74_14640 [Sedimenticola sp.]|nr:hypothetical protein [Sedimenticola sp.]